MTAQEMKEHAEFQALIKKIKEETKNPIEYFRKIRLLAENEKSQRDLDKINHLTEVDWDLVFNISHDESKAISSYRQETLINAGLKFTRGVIRRNMQPVFFIAFETDTVEELNQTKTQVEFIFKHLKVVPELQEKCIDVHNMVGNNTTWSLTYSESTNDFALSCSKYYENSEIFRFETLIDVLTSIQAISTRFNKVPKS